MPGSKGNPGKKRRSRFRRWFRLFLTLLILTTVGVSVGVSGLLVYLGNLPPIEELENYSPPQVTRVFDRTGRVEIARFKRENRVVVPLSAIPEDLIHAFLATEDENFYKHFGIDFKAVLRSAWVNLRARRFKEGFSTIPLQLPRNIRVTSRERKIKRKLRDMVLALQIERRYSKEQILEFYFNQVYLGSGAYGINAAAGTYFDKAYQPVYDAGATTDTLRGEGLRSLTLAECALLAGLPRGPSLYSPIRNPQRGRERRDWVLRRMFEAGYIDREVYEKTRREPIRLHRPEPARDRAPYFVEHLKNWLVKDPQFSLETLYQNGYRIRSTLDVRIQEICDEELRTGLRDAERLWQQRKKLRLALGEHTGEPPRKDEERLAEILSLTSDTMQVAIRGYRAEVALPEHLPYYQPEEVLRPGELIDVRITSVDHSGGRFEAELADRAPIQGAVAVLHARTGEILALSGGYDFYDAENEGQWNRAVQAERQAGSCFKPLVYALALESGLTPATVFNDEWVRFPGGYVPRNYERRYFGPTTLQVGLEHSRNVLTVLLYKHLIDSLGPEQVKTRLLAFDVVGDPSWQFAASDLTIALGSLSITPLELAAAYVTFVNRGVAVTPLCVSTVEDVDRRQVRRFRSVENVLLKPTTAFQMVHLMQSAVQRGTGRPIDQYFAEVRGRDPGRKIPQIGGKTGTTNDCTDAWFAGFTPELVVVVFMGYDAPRSLGPQMSGSKVAGPTWARIVDRILQGEQTWRLSFAADQPPDIVYADVDARTGLAVAQGEPIEPENLLRRVPFLRGTVPLAPPP